jgi:hypothetical protein
VNTSAAAHSGISHVVMSGAAAMRRTSYRACRRGAGPPTWRRDENNSAEADHWAPPGALQVATGFGLDIWVTDTSGGKVNRVGSPEITTTCQSVRRQP